MELDKDKISSPFQAPDGYFERFEDQLRAKLNAPQKNARLKVHKGSGSTYKKLPLIEYAAVAATLAMLVVTAWLMFGKKSAPATEPIELAKNIPSADTPVSTITELVNTPAPEAIESVILADITSGNTDLYQSVSHNNTAESISTADKAIAMQLDDAGLIVMETYDGLFEEFEL